MKLLLASAPVSLIIIESNRKPLGGWGFHRLRKRHTNFVLRMRLANDVGFEVTSNILVANDRVLSQERPLSGLIVPIESVWRMKVFKAEIRRFWGETRGSRFFKALLSGLQGLWSVSTLLDRRCRRFILFEFRYFPDWRANFICRYDIILLFNAIPA